MRARDGENPRRNKQTSTLPDAGSILRVSCCVLRVAGCVLPEVVKSSVTMLDIGSSLKALVT